MAPLLPFAHVGYTVWPPDGDLSRQGLALHESHPAGPNPGRPAQRGKTSTDTPTLHGPTPTMPSPQGQPRYPQEGPTHKTGQCPQDGEQANSGRDVGPVFINNGHRHPRAGAATQVHTEGRPAAPRTLPRTPPRTPVPDLGFYPAGSDSGKLVSDPPGVRPATEVPALPFTAVAVWSPALDGPTASIPPAATGCPPLLRPRNRGSSSASDHDAAADRGGVGGLGAAGRSGG